MSERSSCGASFGNVKISDLDFADDAVVFAETLDILLGALEVLNEELEPLGLWVSWVKTKIQAFNDILDAAIFYVPVCGEDVEVSERFTYLGSDVHVSAGCEPDVNRRLGWTWESWIHWIMGCGTGSWGVGTCAGRRKTVQDLPRDKALQGFTTTEECIFYLSTSFLSIYLLNYFSKH